MVGEREPSQDSRRGQEQYKASDSRTKGLESGATVNGLIELSDSTAKPIEASTGPFTSCRN
jgi:hypothetical protein